MSSLLRATYRTLLLVIVASLAATMLSACDDEDDSALQSFTDFRLDIVTYRGLDNGGVAHFDYVGRNDSAAINITAGNCSGMIPDGLREGNRALLRYRVDETAPTTWKATAYSLQRIISDSLRYNNKPLEEYAMHPVRLRSIWRTGDFINLFCQVEYTGKTRALYLMMDYATIDHETVHCYLVHDLLMAPNAYQWRNCYASFFVGKLLERPSVKQLCIHINDEVFPERETYLFDIRK